MYAFFFLGIGLGLYFPKIMERDLVLRPIFFHFLFLFISLLFKDIKKVNKEIFVNGWKFACRIVVNSKGKTKTWSKNGGPETKTRSKNGGTSDTDF